MTYIHGTSLEIAPYLNNHPLHHDTNTYIGFDLLVPAFFEAPLTTAESGCHYILKLNGKQQVVGALKTKRYSLINHSHVKEGVKTPSYVAIRLIDVFEENRRQNVATELIKELNRQLPPDTILISGKLTDSGKQAKLIDKLNQHLTHATVYQSEIDAVNDFAEQEPWELF